MSRKRRRRYDIAHQVFYASRELERNGISPDLVDLHALIDVELTYSENRANIVLPLIPQEKKWAKWKLQSDERA